MLYHRLLYDEYNVRSSLGILSHIFGDIHAVYVAMFSLNRRIWIMGFINTKLLN